ncbi:MAG: AI-2E family transporter [Haliea sp.]|jgi:predicted PurR-regulated permease PerM|nr:AI-2E family transporter [Haliea sp.]
MSGTPEPSPNRLILLAFLGVALYACYWLIAPFMQPIILGILIGMLAFPLHDWMEKKLYGRSNLAALLGCLALSLLILLPASLVLVAILKQGIAYALVVKEWATEENIHQVLSHPWMQQIKTRLGQVLPPEALDPAAIKSQAITTASTVGKKFAGVSTAMLGSITNFAINFTLLLFVLFFVLRDHDRMITFMRHALPLSRSQEDILFKEVVDVSKSALLGSLLTAATQGLVGGIGLWIAGFPGLFWGAIMAFASLIPFVGTALIWVPAALYLFFTGQTEWGIFMVFWGAVVVGSIDNFLRPLFMQGASMNTVVVFFSLIGGLQLFGLIGLIYGPLIFSITLVFFRLYESEFSEFLDAQDKS